jgi:hypothetical protein
VSPADDEAFEAFVRAHGTTLVRLAGALTGNPHVSEEVVQSALELSGYRAPSDFPERVSHGGLRRARRRRVRRVTCAGVGACAAAVAIAVTAPWASGPVKWLAAPQRLPSAASVGKAMLTAFDAASGDILYSTEVDTNKGQLVDTYQDWNWPAQPVPRQQTRWRERYAHTIPGSGKPLFPVEEFTVSYLSPPVATTVPAQVMTKVPSQVTMVCYARSTGCGMGDAEVPAGTWAEFSYQFTAFDVASGVGAGGMFSPATLAQGIARGQWRVLRRARLYGQPAIVLSETAKGNIAPLPFLLWVSARTGLPVKYASGSGEVTSSGVFVYLRPTPANLALLRVKIPRGYPRSGLVKG